MRGVKGRIRHACAKSRLHEHEADREGAATPYTTRCLRRRRHGGAAAGPV